SSASTVQAGPGPHAFATDSCGIIPTVWYAIVPSTSALTKLFTGSTQSRITSCSWATDRARSMGASTPSPRLGCTSAVDCIASTSPDAGLPHTTGPCAVSQQELVHAPTP